MKLDMETDGFRVENRPIKYVKGRGRNPKYPFGMMKVGHSFHIDGSGLVARRLSAAACQYGKRHGMKFGVVKDGDGYRCGRIK